jgi:hypothetical protein
MSRVVVTAEHAEHAERAFAPMLADEQVHAHLSTEHSAKQFIGVGEDSAPWSWNPGEHERIAPIASYLVVPPG